MIHHKDNLILAVVAEITPFWDHSSYEFVIILTGSLLAGRGRIAVEYIGSAVSIFVEFESFGVRELGSIVGLIPNSV